MKARRSGLFRLALECFLVLIFLFTLTAGGYFAQVWSAAGSANPVPNANHSAGVLATPDLNTRAAVIAAENAALTPPLYSLNLPIIQY